MKPSSGGFKIQMLAECNKSLVCLKKMLSDINICVSMAVKVVFLMCCIFSLSFSIGIILYNLH